MPARLARPSTCTLGSWFPTVPSCSPHLVSFLVPMDSSFSPQSCCVSTALSVPLPCRRSVSPCSLFMCSTGGSPPVVTGLGEQEGTVGDREPSVQVLGRAGRAGIVAAAPPPLASAATVPAHAAAPMAPPLPSPIAAAAAPAAVTGTPALPSPVAVMTPLLSPAVSVTAPAAVGGTPALPSPGAAVTPPLLSPATTATAPAAALS
ncbi:unnamed protein product [Closterium sp. NIES-54]